jgi:hypothetical protein
MYKLVGSEWRCSNGVSGADTSQVSSQAAGSEQASRSGPVGQVGRMGLDQVRRGSPYTHGPW